MDFLFALQCISRGDGGQKKIRTKLLLDGYSEFEMTAGVAVLKSQTDTKKTEHEIKFEAKIIRSRKK